MMYLFVGMISNSGSISTGILGVILGQKYFAIRVALSPVLRWSLQKSHIILPLDDAKAMN
jgi:hypothetical protein